MDLEEYTGCTQFFDYSLDPKHPFYQILPSDNVQQTIGEAFPPPPQPTLHKMLANGQSLYEISDNIKQEHQQKFPIHCAILSDMCKSVAQLICLTQDANSRSLYVPDDAGFLPMHR